MEDQYINALINEIKNSPYGDRVDSVFFGGGTPTAVKTDNLVRVVDEIKGKFGLKECEFTVECNPATIDYEGLVKLKNSGVNRLSIGLQSANDDELIHLGRIHTFDEFLKTYNSALKAGFENINVDLIFSLHNQTLEKWTHSLNEVLKLKPQHISCYSLIVEEGTPYYGMPLNLPDEETDRLMYYGAIDALKNAGYNHYEISNFALGGFECKHNLKYWERKNYLGFGCGASGMYDNVRFVNSYNIKDYINSNEVLKEELTKEQAVAEHIFLGLRLTKGFSVEHFNRLYGVDFMEKYKEQIERFTKLGLLKADEYCTLTLDGLSVSNSVMCEFL